LTVTAFLSPSFWLFALIAVPLLLWGGKKDANPLAFYLFLLHVIPPIDVPIPIVGINALFDLDMYRLLSFCVLIPAARRIWQSRGQADAASGFLAMDLLLIAYGALHIVLYVPPDLPGHVVLPDSLTNMLRRTFLGFIDVYVLYYVVSRGCSSRVAIVEALAAFCLACALVAPIAVFESLRGWLLYGDLGTRWTGYAGMGFYLMRGTTLRALASSGHALALGYMLAIAFAFWLYLRSHVTSAFTRAAVVLLYWSGLLATYSRGQWVGAIAIYLAVIAFGQRAFSRLLKAVALMTIVGGAVLVSPLGAPVLKVIPFMGGTVDSGSVLYRQQLAERTWELIKEHPVLGDQFPYPQLEDLRQGQGIIDFVNTYATVALFYGLVGLFLFIAFILVALNQARALARRVAETDPDLALLGVTLVAAIFGTLVMIAECSFILAYEKLFYVLAGLAAAYARLGRIPRSAAMAAPAAPAALGSRQGN